MLKLVCHFLNSLLFEGWREDEEGMEKTVLEVKLVLD